MTKKIIGAVIIIVAVVIIWIAVSSKPAVVVSEVATSTEVIK